MDEAKLVLVFEDEGLEVMAVRSDGPALDEGLFRVGDTVDAVAFHEACEWMLFNDALVLWSVSGDLLFYAESTTYSNAREWRPDCDALHPCPSYEIQSGLPGCRPPDSACAEERRLVPVVVHTGEGSLPPIEPGAGHTIEGSGVVWAAAALGHVETPAQVCTDYFPQHSVVVQRLP